MAEPKTRKTDASVEAFLKKIDDPQKRADSFALVELMRSVTEQEPDMWGDAIVGFGSQPLKYASSRELDWPLAAFSPRKQNLTLYFTQDFDRYRSLLKKLGKHSTSKSCLYIKKLSDVDMAVLKDLVAESVKAASKVRE